jgi:ATP-dependent helicase/nuclease subunit A
MTKRKPADQSERDKAIAERARNVLVNAGAGTGKTTLLVTRLLQLVAPPDDGQAFTLDRIAAITFTRKAAGELKLRLREALLSKASERGLTALRQQRLSRALEVLDNASISTVHSFADRLLRLRPVDAQLSPRYELTDDNSALVEETFQSLLSAASRVAAVSSDAEASETVRIFQAAGLLVRTRSTDWGDKLGLDAFVSDVIQSRDRPVAVPEVLEAPSLDSVRQHLDELASMLNDAGDSTGTRRVRRLHSQALRIAEAEEFEEQLRRAVAWYLDVKTTGGLQMAKDFPEDPEGWNALKWLARTDRPDGPLYMAIVEPLFSCMAKRIVRLRPVILTLYEQIKREHGMVDQLDLLIQLRNLLASDLATREFYQSRFDHLLVDEFQDTDPLQAEIVMYLCEDGARASRTEEIALQPGKLTIVGDPKQSIYRFRRADIAMYAAVCDKLRASNTCEAQLTVNFRSAASILDWLNAGFDEILGAANGGSPYDPAKGTVRNTRLAPSGKSHPDAGVHVLPFGDPELSADESRDVEGEALAHYLRYLVEESGLRVTDPRTHELRRPRYGDIAIMMIATPTIHHLTDELDRIEVPHVVRGGTLFMEDPLHQQFILGLRALSDRNDGVARAALMRPPFFAISLEDLVRGLEPGAKSEALQASETLITELRRDRHLGTPGEVARRVLERTGFGRYVAAGVNGEQRLARLYQLCLALDDTARTTNLDFDGVTTLARSWIDAPTRIEAPLPVDADAVQVITAHSAKGLEWPIVALWDGRARWTTNLPRFAFTVDGASGQWALKLEGLEHDPTEKALHQREVNLREAERRRVVYVAATRARDILIVPEAASKSKNIASTLILSGKKEAHRRIARYERDGAGWWQGNAPVSMRPIAPLRSDLAEAWSAATKHSFASHLCPAGITTIAHAERVDISEAEDVELPPRERVVGRHGPVFGSTVHRALALVLERGLSPETATRQAAHENELGENVDAALDDVLRAHGALRGAGLLEHTLSVEYPLAGSLEPSSLMSGFIDLIVGTPAGLVVIDFKTDMPPREDVRRTYPAYIEQVRLYARVLEQSGVAGSLPIRTGLLFTGDGALHWV